MNLMARMIYDAETGTVEIDTDENGFVKLTDGLETAVFISLFTNKRARPSDREVDRRGWWGDVHARQQNDQIGSWLWLLRRRNVSDPQTIRLAKLYAEDSLQWLKSDGLAKRISVVAQRESDLIVLRVDILRPDGSTWGAVWDHHGRQVSSGF